MRSSARRTTAILGTAVAAFALLLTACGTDETAAPTATASAQNTATAAATQAAAAGVTVTDLMGRKVTVAKTPTKIVTTSPSALEMLYAAGGTAIARSSTAAAPGIDTSKMTDIGSAYQPNFEAILKLQPDLVVADASAQAPLAGQFEAQLKGVPVVFVGAVKYADVATSIRMLGLVTGTAEKAKTSADAIDATAKQVGDAVKGKTATKTLVVVAGRDGQLSAALNDSFIGDMVKIAGAQNIAADLKQSGQVPGYATISVETAFKENPDVILVIVPGNNPGPSIGAIVSRSFPSLNAVKNKRVHEIDLDVFLQSPGPRAADGLKQLATLIQPDVKLATAGGGAGAATPAASTSGR
ncbi:MAG: ABC transporter substrate-binding protein [Chloroflexi bacterium]|nr:MAG: ABC transporter substrate-binding protein [Chloroflexota bacterium]